MDQLMATLKVWWFSQLDAEEVGTEKDRSYTSPGHVCSMHNMKQLARYQCWIVPVVLWLFGCTMQSRGNKNTPQCQCQSCAARMASETCTRADARRVAPKLDWVMRAVQSHATTIMGHGSQPEAIVVAPRARPFVISTATAAEADSEPEVLYPTRPPQ
jgi:hypothetical protein